MRLPPVIVADAGPLIGLAKIGRLTLLRELYGEILIPPAVHAELQAGSQRPGDIALREALRQTWINWMPCGKSDIAFRRDCA
jgi:predicted nucleic acid-binding protein